MLRRPPRSTRTYTLFPYSTLFRSQSLVEAGRCPAGMMPLGIVDVGAPLRGAGRGRQVDQHGEAFGADVCMRLQPETAAILAVLDPQAAALQRGPGDRKSTRLNSSH